MHMPLLKKLQLESKRLRADINTLPTIKGNGENITLNGTSDARFKKFEISGNSWQETRSGKNYWNNELVKTEGITEKLDTGFKITRSDTSRFGSRYEMKIPAGTYKIISKINTNATTARSGYVLKFNDSTETIFLFQASTMTFSKDVISITPYIDSEESVGTYYEITDLMFLKEDETNETYEPYGAMPSPNYPSEIRNCGDNVNLFDMNASSIRNIGAIKSIEQNKIIIKKTEIRAINFCCIPIENSDKLLNKTVTLSVKEIKTSGQNTGEIGFWDAETNGKPCKKYGQINQGGETITIKLPNEYSSGANRFVIILYSDTSNTPEINSYVEYYDIKLEKGSKATPYSPYGCGNVNFLVTHHNLLKPTWAQDLLDRLSANNISYDKEANKIVEIDGYRYFEYFAGLGYETGLNYFARNCFKENIQYTFKCILMRNNDALSSNIAIRYTDGTTSSPNFSQNANMKRIEYKIISNKNKTIKEIYIFYNSASTYIDLNNVILYEGTEDLPYEGYGQIASFPTKEGQVLHKGDYLDENDIKQMSKKVELTGEETIEKVWVAEDCNCCYMLFTHFSDSKRYDRSEPIDVICKSTHYIATYTDTHQESIANNRKDDVGKPYLISIDCFKTNGNVGNIILKHKGITSVEELKAFFKAQKEKGTPVLIEYRLQEPIIEPYNEEQQEAYNKIKDELHSYKDVTHISSEDEITPNFDVEAIVDLDSYINNKLASVNIAEEVQNTKENKIEETEMEGKINGGLE